MQTAAQADSMMRLTQQNMRDPESFLENGQKFSSDYDFYLLTLEPRVKEFFIRCRAEHLYKWCDTIEDAMPPQLSMLDCMHYHLLGADQRIVLDNGKTFAATLLGRLTRTVDEDMRRGINRLKVLTGFTAWAFVQAEFKRKNVGYIEGVRERVKNRRLQHHGGNLKQLIEALDHDWAILEEAGRHPWSLDEKLEQIELACKAGDKYDFIFKTMHAQRDYQPGLDYDGCCAMLNAYYMRHHSSYKASVQLPPLPGQSGAIGTNGSHHLRISHHHHPITLLRVTIHLIGQQLLLLTILFLSLLAAPTITLAWQTLLVDWWVLPTL